MPSSARLRRRACVPAGVGRWFALLAPAKTPQEIGRALNTELNKMIIREAAIKIN